MTHAYVYDHVRTPRGRGRADGSLHEVPPIDLAAQVLAAVRDRQGLDTSLVDDIYMGCVGPVGEQGANIARVAALVADYDEGVPGATINRFCASGLEAVNRATADVMSGQCQLTIGGGVESMSRVPMGSDGGAWMTDPQIAHKTYFVPQGIGADLVATKYGYSREDVDAYAVESQRRAAAARDSGAFDASIVPVKNRFGEVVLSRDEFPRPGTTLEALAALKPSFAEMGIKGGYDAIALMKYSDIGRIEHVHHGGNSSGIVDGAAAVLIGSEEAGRRLGIRPRARIVSYATSGSEPTIMLTGPASAAERALARAGMTRHDIDLFELNEAFASVVLRFMDQFDIPHDRINVNGGAIALGHPLGATGAMLVGTVLDELERRDLNTGLITLCVGAGMGIATIIERV
jgi:acetyl-CoA C-acetyltransferase